MDDLTSNEHAGKAPGTSPTKRMVTDSSPEPAPESTLDLINRISRDQQRTDNIAKLIGAAGKAIALPLVSVGFVLGAIGLIVGQNPGILALISGVLTVPGLAAAVVRCVTKRRNSPTPRQER